MATTCHRHRTGKQSQVADRPATVTGFNQHTTQRTRSKQTDNAKLDTTTEKWNTSTKVYKPLRALNTPTLTARPTTNTKKLTTVPAVAVEVMTVKELYDQSARTNGCAMSLPCQSKAVEAAFDKAINYREVNSNRLRVGLITNDITPRVYLQVSF